MSTEQGPTLDIHQACQSFDAAAVAQRLDVESASWLAHEDASKRRTWAGQEGGDDARLLNINAKNGLFTIEWE